MRNAVAGQIAIVYRIKTYIIILIFACLLLSLMIAALVCEHAENKQKKQISYTHAALIIFDYYLPILAAISTGIYQKHEEKALALKPQKTKTSSANLFSVLLFTFVLAAPVVAYCLGDIERVNSWIVGSATVLSSLLLTGVGYYFGAEKKPPEAPSSRVRRQSKPEAPLPSE